MTLDSDTSTLFNRLRGLLCFHRASQDRLCYHRAVPRSEFANLHRACKYAAQCLGADFGAVIRFVRSWDDQTLTTDVLLLHLEDMWDERLADAEAMQRVLQSTPLSLCFHE